MEIQFQTISASVRSFRVAVLLDSSDPEWEQSALAISEFLSTLWGGGAGIIVPTDGKSIDELFWIILTSFDPDIVLRYQKTGEDIRRNNPEKFQEILAAHLKKAEQSGPVSDDFKEHVREQLTLAKADNFDLTEELSNEILLRLAPFHWDKTTVEWITAGTDCHYPLTALLDVIGETDHPRQVVNLNKYSGVPPLWLASTYGRGSDTYFTKLAQKHMLVRGITASDWTERDVIDRGTTGISDADLTTPSGFSQIALGSVRSGFAHPYELPNIAVIGDSIKDFCLAYSLIRMHDRVTWAPKWFFEDEESLHSRFMSLIVNLENSGDRYQNRSVTFMSTSLREDEIEALIAPISYLYMHREYKIETSAIKTTSLAIRYPIRYYEKGNLDKPSVHQLLASEIPGTFESPKLKRFLNINAQKQRWLVELSFLKHKTPTHPALGKFMLGAPMLDSNNARAGRDGAAYVCPSAMVQGVDPDFNMVRPVVRVPNAFEIFRQVLHYAGYNAELSDKGRYESVMIEKLGGLEKAGIALRDRQIAACLLKFTDKTTPPKGICDEGVYLRKDERRYLNFRALRKILPREDAAVRMIDDYIASGILYRGFIFGCGHCSSVEWFSVSDISQVFTCRRCGKTQQYKRLNWRIPNEPEWFYKLDEIIYLALVHNCVAQILTLDALRQKTKQSFLHSPEIQISEDGQQEQFMELDICCICDGELTIGEVKSNGSLGMSSKAAVLAVERYLAIGRKIAATNYVFATSELSWDKTSELAIHSVLDAVPSLRYRIITRSDLY